MKTEIRIDINSLHAFERCAQQGIKSELEVTYAHIFDTQFFVGPLSQVEALKEFESFHFHTESLSQGEALEKLKRFNSLSEDNDVGQKIDYPVDIFLCEDGYYFLYP
jgi:hypothetical protein